MADFRVSYIQTWKRRLDIAAALLGIAALAPLLILIAIAVKLGGGGPVLYLQQRIGRNFRPFMIYKFRTMRPGADSDGNTCTVKGDARITPVGRLLRKTKLDELPQLFNVLKGDMSLVGPRPEVERYVELFREDYAEVLSVRPGITDYAAIEYSDEEEVLQKLVGEKAGRLDCGQAGRESDCLPKYFSVQDAYVAEVLPAKIELYKKYIAEQSFLTDLALIMKTLLKIVRR